MHTSAHSAAHADTAPSDIAYVDDAIYLFAYRGAVRKSLARYKFGNRPSYSRTFANLLARFLNSGYSVAHGIDMLVAVPLHAARELERGYDQAFLIARKLSEPSGIPLGRGLLLRRTGTRRQSSLSKADRSKNVRGAFYVKRPGSVKGRSILLIDDIITTGSTVSECARVLKEAGAAKVAAAAVASGRKGLCVYGCLPGKGGVKK